MSNQLKTASSLIRRRRLFVTAQRKLSKASEIKRISVHYGQCFFTLQRWQWKHCSIALHCRCFVSSVLGSKQQLCEMNIKKSIFLHVQPAARTSLVLILLILCQKSHCSVSQMLRLLCFSSFSAFHSMLVRLVGWVKFTKGGKSVRENPW